MYYHWNTHYPDLPKWTQFCLTCQMHDNPWSLSSLALNPVFSVTLWSMVDLSHQKKCHPSLPQKIQDIFASSSTKSSVLSTKSWQHYPSYILSLGGQLALFMWCELDVSSPEWGSSTRRILWLNPWGCICPPRDLSVLCSFVNSTAAKWSTCLVMFDDLPYKVIDDRGRSLRMFCPEWNNEVWEDGWMC